MPSCVVCGNDYDKAFEIVKDGKSFFFDCFECAIHKLAPKCVHCNCKIIGHGMETNNNFYCCANCAKKEGEKAFKDRV